MSGILELLSETNQIAYIEPTDSQIRKNVWGEAPRIGRKALKEKAMKFTGAKSDDEADAIMASLIDPETIFT